VKRTKLTAAVAAILLTTSPLAFAQNVVTTDRNAATVVNPAGDHILPDQFRATKMVGSTVYDVQDRDIGSVKDLVIDRNGKVAAAVVDIGTFLGMGGKYIAVPLDNFKTDNNRLTLDMTKEQLQQAQAYNLTEPNTGSGSTTGPATGGNLGPGNSSGR
jgi:sporulation protein YlmC with PRC-barrel domain